MRMHCVLYSKLFLVKGQYPFSLMIAALRVELSWSSWNPSPFGCSSSPRVSISLFHWKMWYFCPTSLKMSQGFSLHFFFLPFALFMWMVLMHYTMTFFDKYCTFIFKAPFHLSLHCCLSVCFLMCSVRCLADNLKLG